MANKDIVIEFDFGVQLTPNAVIRSNPTTKTQQIERMVDFIFPP